MALYKFDPAMQLSCDSMQAAADRISADKLVKKLLALPPKQRPATPAALEAYVKRIGIDNVSFLCFDPTSILADLRSGGIITADASQGAWLERKIEEASRPKKKKKDSMVWFWRKVFLRLRVAGKHYPESSFCDVAAKYWMRNYIHYITLQ
jgi:hypothetical protein